MILMYITQEEQIFKTVWRASYNTEKDIAKLDRNNEFAI